jgi:DNA-binding protein H-NS
MDVSALLALRGRIDAILAGKRKELERALADLDGGKVGNGRIARGVGESVKKADGRGRAKPAPKYRSRKDKSMKWSGRGLTPRWMRAEMKGTKLKKDDFLIK